MSFHVVIEGEYGEPEGQISLRDGEEELVMWTADEWIEDPSLVYVIAEAIRVGYAEGASAIRARLAGDAPPERSQATDPAGTLHPDWPQRHRFHLWVDEHDPQEEDGWRFKLRIVDCKYQDSEGFPVDAVMAGNSWAEAFAHAGQAVDRALATDHCIFV